MADKVNLRESEYQTIVSELSNLHTTQLQNLENVMQEIRTLVTNTDAFSTNLTSKKVTDMLDTLSTDVVALLQQAFQDSEAGVGNMITTIMVTDSACN